MKNVLVLGVVALALVGCGKKEEAAPAPEAVPAAEAPATPAAEGQAPGPGAGGDFGERPSPINLQNADGSKPAQP